MYHSSPGMEEMACFVPSLPCPLGTMVFQALQRLVGLLAITLEDPNGICNVISFGYDK